MDFWDGVFVVSVTAVFWMVLLALVLNLRITAPLAGLRRLVAPVVALFLDTPPCPKCQHPSVSLGHRQGQSWLGCGACGHMWPEQHQAVAS